MSRLPEREGYSRRQILLHWTVVLLVLFQWLAHEGMHHAWRGFQRGEPIAANDLLFANLHAAAGIVIFFCALWRVYLRFARGAPPAPAGEHPALKWLARVTHFLIYALIIGMPISGATAWFLGVRPAAEAHEVAFNVLFVLVILHILGALAQQFVFRTGVLMRMLVPER